ncbi:hypothetical protein Tco_1321915, partial [Tanacetum coccineum]
MSTPKFAETHNLVAFLEKPEESNGFDGIINFLNASSIKYVLTVNPTIYESCIQQFWATAKAKTVNGERQIQTLVDKKKVIITEKSVRSDLMLEDAEGTECLPNDVLDLEEAKTAQAKDIAILNKRVKELEKRRKSRTSRLKMLRVTLMIDSERRYDEKMFFDVQDDLQGEEVIAEKEVAKKEVSATDPVTTAGEVVTAASATTIVDELTLAQTLIEIKAAKPKVVTIVATTITIVLANTRLKAKGIVFHDQEEQAHAFTPIVSSSQASPLPQPKDKGKAKMKLFDKAYKQVNSFVPMDSKEVEIKKHIEIVKDDEVAIDAIPLATKPSVIIEYMIDKDGRMGYFKLIRADGSSKRYSSMIKMLQDIDREDLETLKKLVKAKHENIRPEEDYERVLWGDLKVMFEPDIK